MRSAEPALSVVIPTLDRRDDLDRALAAIEANVRPHRRGPIETIVVDNGSTDDTPAVAAAWSERIPDLRYVVEPRTGLNHGRNCGLANARSENVAFLDDDATVRPGWSDQLIDALGEPDVVAVAGRILLAWPDGEPWWYSPQMEGWFTHLDLGDEPRPLDDDVTPWGANMAVKRSAAEAAGGFDASVGRVGKSLLSGGEVKFFRDVRAATAPHGRFVYSPAAVDHHVHDHRISLRWVARRAFDNGRSLAYMHNHDHSGQPDTWHLKRSARAALNALFGGHGRTVDCVRRDEERGAALMGELSRRAQALGRGAYHLEVVRGRRAA